MDTCQYTTLAAALTEVPDPRQRRGQRYPWSLLLILFTAALASGERHERGIGQWVQEPAPELAHWLGWSGPRFPSEATVRRALREVDLGALDARLAQLVPAAAPTGTRWRGARARREGDPGSPSPWPEDPPGWLASHQGEELGQMAVAEGSNEIPVALRVLSGRDLRGTVTTLDAHLIQRHLAAQIRAQGGHYLLVV